MAKRINSAGTSLAECATDETGSFAWAELSEVALEVTVLIPHTHYTMEKCYAYASQEHDLPVV